MKKNNDVVFDMLKKEAKHSSAASDGLLSDTKWWIDTGSYMFNALLSGSFFKGFPGNKIVGFAGSHSSGKSMLTMHILKYFLKSDIKNKIIYFDSEGAITTDMIKGVGFDRKRFFHVVVGSANEFKSLIFKSLNYIEELEKGKENMNKYFIVLDSLGHLGLKEEKEKILKDKDTADMGKTAAYNKSTFRQITSQLSVLQIPMIVTSHVYDTMSLYSQKQVSGGSGLLYAANIIVEFTPSKIKAENEIIGTNITARARKSRSTVQYKKVELALLHQTGLSRYYGLLEFALEFDYFKKDGNKIKVNTGEVVSKKDILDSPDKYFTKEVLTELDVFADKYFSYGSGEEEVEEILMDITENLES